MRYPALDVRCDNPDLLLAILDDFSPTAIEESGDGIRAFFPTASVRDAARTHLAPRFDVSSVDVPDEDWARRSQENLPPITVGRITVVAKPEAISHQPALAAAAVTLVIQPSMGFGTGHHATTRLCLEALQMIDLDGKTLLDAGTGSGILAIAASRLGASRAIGIDDDADAIQAARENLELNPPAAVTFVVGDLRTLPLQPADILTANLTGALLTAAAATLAGAVRPGGRLILSGILADERDSVVRAFAPATIVWEREDEGWLGLALEKSVSVNQRAPDPV